jgi:hypothetical protein
MDKRLNIVNGDACIKIMREAGIEGDFLAWIDFLHEGPVPANLSLDKLSKIRAKFISDYGFGSFTEIMQEFYERDEYLKTYTYYSHITLWFEHDLYDQLQLLQILSWFSIQDLEHTTLSIVATNNYLGECSTQQIKKLLHYETPVTSKHFEIANNAWHAFCHNSPEKWIELLDEPTAILPYLKGAVYRMLEEYPNTKCGLSRTEFQALAIIASGENNPLDIFTKYQTYEERRFMGDTIFWKILENFQNYGVIENIEGELQVTALGQKLLDGKEYWFNIKPFEKWIGGVKLTPDNLWCWNVEKRELQHYYYSSVINSLIKVK